ncbi:MAG: hypothetical protein UX58_C0002G0099 [Candidatus Wolfebacteria bacterium GW2011_GWB2_46_69]|nr:MAG: hypothetical protein UX58_C0002G0099 [Candidatus Wolfebacteria bacterium GW2011_GWB2_46_69]KKU66182.1 MAG: hypothetical protein UX90_C0001G0241 [Candidatus Wolfebacteria bacterium GW2011_GWD2_47_17]
MRVRHPTESTTLIIYFRGKFNTAIDHRKTKNAPGGALRICDNLRKMATAIRRDIVHVYDLDAVAVHARILADDIQDRCKRSRVFACVIDAYVRSTREPFLDPSADVHFLVVGDRCYDKVDVGECFPKIEGNFLIGIL